MRPTRHARRWPIALLPILWLTLFGSSPADQGAGDAPAAPPETFDQDQREHWAYQPIGHPEPPEVVEASWPRNPIDRFILGEMEALEFEHAAELDRIGLIRRATFDLIGLPPTPEEVRAFLVDDRPDAFERVVDRLLDSPSYGQRWAQHWLDLAHYADSNGFELDAERPDAWRYRDWVVRALNDDLPYEEFLALQLAGDELRPDDPEALIATGFGRCGPREVVGGNIDPAVKRQSELTEITSTVGSVFLGLTVGCARCHDHKFDAIPTTDYYRLQSFFADAEMIDVPIADQARRDAFEEAKAAVDAQIKPLREAMSVLESPYRDVLRQQKRATLTPEERLVLETPEDQRTPRQQKLAEGVDRSLVIRWEEVAEAVAKNPDDHAERERLKRAISDLEQSLPPPPAQAMALIEPTDDDDGIPPTYVLHRGDPGSHGPLVEPRPIGVALANMPADAFESEDITDNQGVSGRRRSLAEWLRRDDNPLTARVIVNRLWQHHYGRGIVATPSDFGVRGEIPSHPDLLDWLARELIRNDWRLKPLHRLMMTSATYRQAGGLDASAIDDPARRAAMQARSEQQRSDDPDNLLVSWVEHRRLEAESLRDALLAVTGELNSEMDGPGVRTPIPEEVEALIFTEAEVVDLWPEDPDPDQHHRRSLYLFRKRNVRDPIFDAFDSPDTQTPCAVRDQSTHALQSLILLNSAFAIDRAKALAGRVFREAPNDPDARVRLAYRLVLARSPRPEEVERALGFLEGQGALLDDRTGDDPPLAAPDPAPEGLGPAQGAAWVDFALALLNCNEFLYVP